MTHAANAGNAAREVASEGDGQEGPDPLASLGPGSIIEGKHRVDRIIGRGGMGVVAAATHIHLNERVALKFLQVKDGDVSQDFRARFALEARVCAKLRNEHIARVHDVGIWEGKAPFMVMEYLEGNDLRRLLKDGARLPLAQAVEYVVQVCDGLAEAHAQGIVHRDLKPPNLFITRRPDGSELVKVLDFGISKWTSAEEDVGELTKTGVMLGSPKYMSPEQLNGDTIDSRADLWSIGAILYQMLTGRPPYDFPQVTQTFMAIASGQVPARASSLEPSIPAAVDAVIFRCLTREKDKRFQNVAELAGALLEAVDSPFAGRVRAQISSVLDPVALSNRAGPMSITTGSHAVFSVTSTGMSTLPEVILTRDSSVRPAPLTKSRSASKPVWIAGAALLALGIAAFARTPGAAMGVGVAYSAGSGAASPSKLVASKQLSHDVATTLTSDALVPVDSVVMSPIASPRGAVREAPRAIAHPAAPPHVAAPPAAPSVSAPAAPAPAPAVHPAAHPAATNTLDDRQ